MICVPNFRFLGWFSFSLAVNNFWQLLTAVTIFFDGIFIFPLKLIPLPNFSSLGRFSFSSVVNSFWQLSQFFFDRIFIYPLKLIPVPNFSSLGRFSFSSVVNSFWQLMTAVTNFFWWDLHIPPKADTCAKFQLSRLLGGSARDCDVQTYRLTHARWR